MTPPTPVPLAPTYVKGVINLRGNIIPVVDLRERLHIESIPYNQSTVVIIVNTNRPDENKVIGVIVDAVSDVYKISKDEIKPKPAACDLTDNEYIEGLVSVKQANDTTKLVIIINIDNLMDIREIYTSKIAAAESNVPT